MANGLTTKQAWRFDDESWLPVPGYEGIYAVSACGRIKRVIGGRATQVGRILKACHHPRTGYDSVQLFKCGEGRRVAIHAIVASAFIGEKPIDFVVNHKDGNKTNNHVSNLEYLTHGENIKHAFATGLRAGSHGERSGHHVLTEQQVLEIRAQYGPQNSYATLGKKYGVAWSTIRGVVKRRTWAHI